MVLRGPCPQHCPPHPCRPAGSPVASCDGWLVAEDARGAPPGAGAAQPRPQGAGRRRWVRWVGGWVVVVEVGAMPAAGSRLPGPRPAVAKPPAGHRHRSGGTDPSCGWSRACAPAPAAAPTGLAGPRRGGRARGSAAALAAASPGRCGAVARWLRGWRGAGGAQGQAPALGPAARLLAAAAALHGVAGVPHPPAPLQAALRDALPCLRFLQSREEQKHPGIREYRSLGGSFPGSGPGLTGLPTAPRSAG